MAETNIIQPIDLSVLVLNKHYMALRVVRVKRAMSLLFRNLAEVISYEEEAYNNYDFSSWMQVSEYRIEFESRKHDWLSTVNCRIAVPRIIRLLEYDRLPKRIPIKLNRKNLFARDKNHCQYCNKKFPTTELSIDHIVPRSQGGRTTWKNVVCSCVKCNSKKGGRTPAQANMKLVNEPKEPTRNPSISLHLSSSRYRSWKKFLDYAYWSVELK